MVIRLIIVAGELLLIFFLCRQIAQLIYTLFYLPARSISKKSTAYNFSSKILALLFLPGTIIHELSHALTAQLLGVKIKEIILYPHEDEKTGEWKAGTTIIAKTDQLRLALIGIAPLLIGVILLNVAVFYLFNFSLPWDKPVLVFDALFKIGNYPLFFFIFIISTTMFTSRSDLREFLLFLPAVLIVLLLLYPAGFRIILEQSVIDFLTEKITVLAFVLGMTLLVDLIIYFLIFIPTVLVLYLLNLLVKRKP